MPIYVSVLIVSVALISGAVCWRYLSVVYKVLFAQVCGATIVEIAGYIIGFYNNNVPLFNAYIVFELWVMGIVAILLSKNRIGQYLLVAGLLFCSLVDAYFLWRDGVAKLATYGLLCHCLLFLTAFLILLIRSFTIKNAAYAFRDPDTWLCLAMIIYCGGDVPVLGFFNEMISHHPRIARSVYNINSVLCIVRYSLISVAFFMQRRTYALKPAVA